MAFEQDYMDRNSAERFPIGHALDLRGHELAALGQNCAAWIEVRERSGVNEGANMNANTNTSLSPVEEIDFELRVTVFPWVPPEERVGQTKEEEEEVEKEEEALAVCSVQCPPSVNLATVTGIWLDAVQGRIFLGLKWGKFVILEFD